MSIWDNITSFFSKSDNNKTKRPPTDYPIVDFTDDIVCNTALTKGLYKNTYPGYKFAGVFAKNIIDTPIAFCGYPTIDTDDEDVINFFDDYNPDFVKILRQSHREGTVWMWPWYDSKAGKVKLKFIQDDWVTDIFEDPTTDELLSIVTTKTIPINTAQGYTVQVREKTTYTKTKITTTYDNYLKSNVKRNVLGILPIGFANMTDGGERRGTSDYTNILPDMMDYHRTALSMSVQLNDFKTKIVQTIDGNPDVWAENQGFNNIDDFMANATPQKVSIIFNGEKDSTEFIIAKGAIDSNIAAMKISYKKIVQGCRVPELFWGLKQEGNTNTAEEAMTALINLVDEKRIQATANFVLLMNSMLRLDAMSKGSQLTEEYQITWNQLDAVSDVSRSEIWSNFCTGISKAWDSGVLTPGMAYDLWNVNYPGVVNITEEEFITGIVKTMSLLKSKNSSYDVTLGENPLDQL